MELWRYYRILRRRRWLILICMAICVGSVWYFNKFMTPVTYTGETRVMERQPTEMGVPVYGNSYMVQPNVEIHLADLANIAASDTVLKRSRDSLVQLGISMEPEEIFKNLKIEPVPDTQILSIKVTSEDPEEAKSAADVVSSEFQRFYRELVSGATEQSRDFIEKQLQDAKAKLTKARAAMMEYKTQNSVIELQGQTKVLIERTAAIENEEIHAKIQANAYASQLQSINGQLEGLPQMKLAAETVMDNPIYKELISKQVAMETALGTMIGRRGANHPEVKSLTKEIAQVKEQIKSQAPKIVSAQTTQLDPVVTQALQNKLVTNAEAAGTSAREGALSQVLDEQRAGLQGLPEKEMKMAQLDLDVKASESTYGLLRSKLDEARIKANETTKSSSIQVIAAAYVMRNDAKKPFKMALALLLSPLLGAGLAFLFHYLDNTIRTPAEAEDLLGLPIVTVVPLSRSHALARRPDNEHLQATYDMLTAAMWQNLAKTESPAVLVASAEPETGRTTTAANLAVTLAHDGARVILVDADMRKPNLHLMFGLPNKPGLSNVLSGTLPIEDALIPTKIEGLLLMPGGPSPDNPVRLLRSQQMTDFVKEIGGLADFVVFDSPAGITFADASMLAAIIKNVVIVHSAGKVPRGAEAEFRNRLDMSGANILGSVLNKVRAEDSHGYFHYKRFYQDATAQSMLKTAAALSGAPAFPPRDAGGSSNDRV